MMATDSVDSLNTFRYNDSQRGANEKSCTKNSYYPQIVLQEMQKSI